MSKRKNRVLHKKANGNKMWKTMNTVGQDFSQRKIHAKIGCSIRKQKATKCGKQ
jgi:hypothetical protein